MNKKIIIIGVVIAVIVIVIALSLVFKGGKDKGNGLPGIVVTDRPAGENTAAGTTTDANAVNLQTSDDMFTQLDKAADYAD